MTVYYAKVFKQDVPKAVDILADILQFGILVLGNHEYHALRPLGVLSTNTLQIVGEFRSGVPLRALPASGSAGSGCAAPRRDRSALRCAAELGDG